LFHPPNEKAKILRFRKPLIALKVSPVKVITLFLAVALSATAAPNDPARVAVDFLEKVRLGKLDLEPGGDTALSAQTVPEKKHQIARNFERMARDLGSAPLEVSAVKLDEDFAAVLVRKIGGFDPARLQIFPLAMIKRSNGWTVAPVPASFENCGTGYASDLRKRLEKLETWMLREQIVDLEQLREQSITRMREKIGASYSASEMRRLSAETFGERFLDACDRKDLPSLLGFFGGLSEPLPADWPIRLKSLERAVASGSSVKRPWRLLFSPEVARVVVGQEEDDRSGRVSVACLDPAGSGEDESPPQIEIVHLELSRDGSGLWQINPPEVFLDPDLSHESDDSPDRELSDSFAEKWIAKKSLLPQISAEHARRELIAALGSGSFPAVLSITKIDGATSDSRQNCIQAAKISHIIQNPSAVSHVIPLSFHAVETSAVGLFQIFTARDPMKYRPTLVYFEKSSIGWLWAPVPLPDTLDRFRAWAELETKTWRNQWQKTVLDDCPVVDTQHLSPRPSEDQAKALVEQWFEAIQKGDIKAALQLVTRMDGPQSGNTILQNLGYEITSARRNNSTPEIVGIYSDEHWAAVGVKTKQDEIPKYPFYPIIRTSQGPRILIEIDLFATTNRGREFLNKAAFGRLGEPTPLSDELQNLFSKYQIAVASLAQESRR
jgi:hypothetical protein